MTGTDELARSSQDPRPPTLNALTGEAARAHLLTCLDVPRWAEEVLAGRPYADPHQLETAMRAAGRTLSDEELTRALARHPRIGERPDATRHDARHSEHEQAGVDRTDDELARRLVAGNRAYEERFGRVFIIRAAGRDGAEVLDELQRRLAHSDEQERAETIEQLLQIALLRVREVSA